MKIKLKMILLVLLVIFLVVAGYFFVGVAPHPKGGVVFGVNFSPKHAQNLKLDWRENYLALLDDLNVKNLKIIVHWDWVEGERDKFYFDDLDWMKTEAEKRGAKIILVIGMKTGRWPECHVPEWASLLTKAEQQERVLKLVREIILRYNNSETVWAWQVENEPFFPFGECPWSDFNFVEEEIALVRSLDSQKRPVLFTDSGEGSFWIKAAKLGDMVGITMYRRAWFSQLERYVDYPLPPVFYWRKANIIKKIFNKKVMVTELQAEPWGPKLLYDVSVEEQEKTMNLEKFRENIDFAKRTGLSDFYLWGSEWWYWMKTKQGKPEIWQEAQGLFKQQ
jgi:hypothetical protein